MSQVKANSFTDASGGSNAVLYGVAAPANSMGFRNRIINGDMRIDQRNAGASVTITSTAAITYTLDRWYGYGTQASKFSVQRSAGSVTPPSGFADYLGVTSLAATSVGSGDYFELAQRIEGFNTSDLAWGTANAQAVTVSFRVYSSLTGTFGGAVRNSASSRSYPFSYAIASANTWTTVSVTIPGDTSGTWLTTNGTGLLLCFGLGSGSTYTTTAGSWAAGAYIQPTGTTSVVGTNGATFYITGVQLEAGSVASPFERRDYGRELMMCQRYYESYYFRNTTYGMGSGTSTIMNVPIKVTKRATPTTTIGSDPVGWTVNFPSASATNYNEDSLAIVSTGATSSAVRYGAILSFSAEL